jgi:ABC-2 type transport system ATP-binding protein
MRGGPQGPPRPAGTALAIEAQGLGRDYGDTRALDALDLRVPTGSLIGLLGPNGAGKTTAMLLLATLLSPSRGRAAILGHDVTRARAAVRRRLGLVFQEPSVDGLLTVEENLRFAGGLMGLGAAALRQAVSEAIERTGLEAHAARPARQLSGGWRRLADIARATVHRPDVLILDEPTVGLDPEHRERVWRFLLDERRQRGTTIVFSTHYLLEAEPADAVVLLAGGRAVANDRPGALVSAIGEHVIDLEGADAEAAVTLLRDAGVCQTVVHSGRGYRVGIAAGHDALGILARQPLRVTRLERRKASLEDVYFARTAASPAHEPAGATDGRRVRA